MQDDRLALGQSIQHLRFAVVALTDLHLRSRAPFSTRNTAQSCPRRKSAPTGTFSTESSRHVTMRTSTRYPSPSEAGSTSSGEIHDHVDPLFLDAERRHLHESGRFHPADASESGCAPPH